MLKLLILANIIISYACLGTGEHFNRLIMNSGNIPKWLVVNDM